METSNICINYLNVFWWGSTIKFVLLFLLTNDVPGTGTIYTTLTVTHALNGTTRTFLYTYGGVSQYPYETGMMIVECKCILYSR